MLPDDPPDEPSSDDDGADELDRHEGDDTARLRADIGVERGTRLPGPAGARGGLKAGAAPDAAGPAARPRPIAASSRVPADGVGEEVPGTAAVAEEFWPSAGAEFEADIAGKGETAFKASLLGYILEEPLTRLDSFGYQQTSAAISEPARKRLPSVFIRATCCE